MKQLNLSITRMALAACLLALGTADLMAQQRFSSGSSRFGSSSSRSRSSSQYGANAIGEAIFEVDPDTGQLIVIADDETNEHIKQLLSRLDRPVPQVLIKVLFLEVTYSNDLDVGTNLAYNRLESDGDQTLLTTIFGFPESLRGGNATLVHDDLTGIITALAKVGKLEVLSRPSIMARNNQEAVIIVGQEVPFIRDSRITEQNTTINTIEYEDIGIILTVTPFIASDGKTVELQVAPEISTLTGETVTISESVNAPVFAKRSAETNVIVPDGKTVVIGGLMENKKTESIQKVPILGDLWLLGALFRRTVIQNSKTELMIFLTPHVVKDTYEYVDLTKQEKGEAELIPKAYSPEELDKYLPNVDDD